MEHCFIDAGIETINDTEVLKSHLCNYNDAYILLRGNIFIVGENGTQVSFRN